MHPRNSVFCGQSFQIFSSLSNSQSLDFSQKCSKYQQLCWEKVNKGSASKVKQNWRRSLFGFGCHIFSQVLAAQSEMLTQKLQDWKKIESFFVIKVNHLWCICFLSPQEGGDLDLHEASHEAVELVGDLSWTTSMKYMKCSSIYVMKYTFKTSCCVVFKPIAREIPRTCTIRFWNILEVVKFCYGEVGYGKFWGRDNLPTWQQATCLSTGQRG